MSEREYAVRVFDGTDLRIVPVGASRYWAERRAEKFRAAGAIATVLFKFTFMPDMPWEDA